MTSFPFAATVFAFAAWNCSRRVSDIFLGTGLIAGLAATLGCLTAAIGAFAAALMTLGAGLAAFGDSLGGLAAFFGGFRAGSLGLTAAATGAGFGFGAASTGEIEKGDSLSSTRGFGRRRGAGPTPSSEATLM
jgi:hypothetical protein